jgi:hypothetical protein
MAWLAAASELGGKALAVGLYVWFVAGMDDCLRVRLSTHKLQEFGMTRQSAYQALTALEQSQLISVERRPGSCPFVTLKIGACLVSETANSPNLS